MTALISGQLPDHALLQRYQQSGAYTDCYWMDLPRPIAMPEYIEAFYTTPLFKIERWLLATLIGKPSTDADAQHLAQGHARHFAAWDTEARTADQLLLRDFTGQTRSWLMIAPEAGQPASTRLYFGSAFMPKSRSAKGKPSFSVSFHALSGFHRIYTKALMRAARDKLLRSEGNAAS